VDACSEMRVKGYQTVFPFQRFLKLERFLKFDR